MHNAPDLPHPPDHEPPDHDPRLPLAEPFTLSQAADAGVSRYVVTRMLREGIVRRVLPGVFIDSAADDDLTMRCKALGLVLPEDAVVVDRTAAWLHGVDVLGPGDHVVPPPLQVFRRPGRTRMRKAGAFGGERTLSEHDVEVVGGIPVLTPLRTASTSDGC